jgi:hypothetical protein
MKEMGGWSPKPAPAGPAAPSVLRHPQGTPRLAQNICTKAHSVAWTTALAVLCSTPEWVFSDLCRTSYAGLTERRSRLIGPVSPMKHGRYAEFSKQTFLPGKTIAR